MNKKYKKVVLDNGIRLYVHSDKSMRKTMVSYTVDYGSSGEYFRFNYNGKDYSVLPGCAHFLEHMLLEHSSYGNLYNMFHLLKYNANAYTSIDKTKYYFTGVSKIKSSIKKMIYALEKPVFNDKDIKETSYAIVEETKRFANDPYFCASALNARNCYKNFELVHESLNVIGNEQTTKALDYDMLKTCYNAFYTDDRKIIVVAGPIDEDDIINYIKKIYKGIKPHKNNTKLYIPENINEVRNKYEVIKKDIEDDSLFIFYNQELKGFSKFEITSYLRFISSIKFSNRTKFYEKLNNNEILISYYGLDYNFIFDDYHFNFGYEFRIRDKEKFLKEYYKEIKNIDFKEYDFNLFKKSLISNDIIREEDKYSYYNFLSESALFFGDPLDVVEAVKTLKYDRLIKFYNSLDFNNEVMTLLTKEG